MLYIVSKNRNFISRLEPNFREIQSILYFLKILYSTIEKTNVTTALNESSNGSNWVTAFPFSRHTWMCVKDKIKFAVSIEARRGIWGKWLRFDAPWTCRITRPLPGAAVVERKTKKAKNASIRGEHLCSRTMPMVHGRRSMTTWKVGARTNARARAGKTEWRKKGRNTFGLAVGGWASNSGHRARMTSNRSRALCQHYVAKSTVVLIRHQEWRNFLSHDKTSIGRFQKCNSCETVKDGTRW